MDDTNTLSQTDTTPIDGSPSSDTAVPAAATELAQEAPFTASTANTARPAVIRVEAAIAAWMVESVFNSPLARNTEAYNHLVAVLPALQARIVALIPEV